MYRRRRPKKYDSNFTAIEIPKGVTQKLTGKYDAAIIRNRYQKELNECNISIVKHVHYTEKRLNELKDVYNEVQALKSDITAHELEREKLYENLSNLLTKETNFEKDMWKTTQKGRKVKSINIKQKFHESDVEQVHDSMMQYLQKYPKYASKSSFSEIIERIKDKERSIRNKKQEYNHNISDYNSRLSKFEKRLLKIEEKFNAYDKVLNEWKEKISDLRYYKTPFYKLSSEKVKIDLQPDVLQHRIEQFRKTYEYIKGEVSQSKKKKFEEIEY